MEATRIPQLRHTIDIWVSEPRHCRVIYPKVYYVLVVTHRQWQVERLSHTEVIKSAELLTAITNGVKSIGISYIKLRERRDVDSGGEADLVKIWHPELWKFLISCYISPLYCRCGFFGTAIAPQFALRLDWLPSVYIDGQVCSVLRFQTTTFLFWSQVEQPSLLDPHLIGRPFFFLQIGPRQWG